MDQWIIYLLGVLVFYGSHKTVDGQFNYSMCENSICIAIPENCLQTLNCLAVGKVAKISSDVFEFELQTIPETNPTTPPVYVAIGLSLDSRMEDDSVVECVMLNNEVEVFMSYTRQSPRSAERHTYIDEINVTAKSYTDGSIRCVFQRKALTVINDRIFDLNQMPNHLLLAMGNAVDVNSLQRHTMRLASPEPLIVPESEEVPNQNIDYNACGKTQTCFGMPSGCTTKKICHTAVTISYAAPTYKFQMFTSAGIAYVAVGLSIDDRMGEDLVVECVREMDTVNMYTSYTRYDAGSDRHFANGSATLLDSSYVDNVIYCYVERTETANVFGQEFDLSKQPYYILLAIGDEATTTMLTYHKQRQVSSQAIQLTDIVDLSQSSKPILVVLHGCFMIFAWMGTAAIGLVLARFFKSEWSNKTIFGKELWFIGHISCMLTTWSLTLVGFVIIFVHVGGWTQIGNTHAILGVIVTILCFFHPKHPKRYRFNIGHYFGGRLIFLLATINIFYAIFLSSAEMPLWFLAFMVIFAVVFWGNHILMGTMEYLADSKRNLVRAFVGPAKRIDYATADYNAWYVRLKMKVFVGYLVVIITLVIGSICVVVLNRN